MDELEGVNLKKVIPLIITILLAAAGVIVTVIFFVSKAVRYEDHFVSDQTANVNVMLTRPDDWQQIMKDQDMVSEDVFRQIDGSTATIPITAELARQMYGPWIKAEQYVDHNTTHNAYVNLIETASDTQDRVKDPRNLIFVTEPSKEELDLAREAGVELEVTPIALDGFVFITHKDNPVDSLTVEQVQKIYQNEITNWKEVGGNDERIVAFQREPNSGSQTAMEQMVMQGKELPPPETGYTVRGMGPLVEQVAAEYTNNTRSIGYTYLYYINNLYKNEDIKVLKIDGVYPSNENLLDHSYPFTTAYYEVRTKEFAERAQTEPDSISNELNALYEYLQTDEGQEVIKQAGYCPVR